jgi:tetratricopeptide (TPR) repeat protein
MHQLAIAKILVFTHGKSDFRLVAAHFALGRAYLESNCYEQAVSHLTIASTKVSKMGDIKETKIYNSYILTALARCYLSLDGYSHSLELLTRAYDIQSNNQNIKGSSLAEETLELLARVYLNMKMPKDAIRITDKLIDILKAQFSDYESIFNKLT